MTDHRTARRRTIPQGAYFAPGDYEGVLWMYHRTEWREIYSEPLGVYCAAAKASDPVYMLRDLELDDE